METSDVINVLAGTNTWTLIKSCGGTHTLSPNSPSRLKVKDLILTNDLGHAPAPGSVTNLLWYALTNETVALQVMPGPFWVTNNPAAAASLFDWTTNNVALPVTTNLTQTFAPAWGTNLVNVACHSPAPATPTNQVTTVVGQVVKVSVDTNRDGKIDEDDEDGKEEWTIDRGAFVTVDKWLVGDLAGVPDKNITSLAPVVIQPIKGLEDGWTVKVKLLGLAGLTLVSADKATKIGPGPTTFTTNASWLATEPVTLYAATEWARAGRPNFDELKIVLELYSPDNNLVGSDTVLMQLAPIILPWNSLTLERLYCTAGFPEDVCWPNHALPTKQKVYPLLDGQWVQDMMELGKSQFAGTSFLDQVVDLGYGSTYVDANLLTEDDFQWHKNEWSYGGNGGNIEVFPPYTDSHNVTYPFGRVVLGSINGEESAAEEVQHQGLQKPITLTYKLDHTRWLDVSHIDEVFCFLRPDAMLKADPSVAWQEIIEMINNPARSKMILAGLDKNWHDSWQNVTNDVNFFFSQTRPLEQFLDVTPQSFTVTQGTYLKNDYLLIDREVLLVTNVTVAGGQTTLEVKRGQPFGNSGQSHAVGARIRKLSPEFAKNVYPQDASSPSDHEITASLRSRLCEELATSVTAVPIPVVFGDAENGRCAATANMVNCVVDGGDIYATDPGDERFRQLFQMFVAETVHWVDGPGHEAWNNYHRWKGELHCGSNAKRTFPADIWWTMSQYRGWPD